MIGNWYFEICNRPSGSLVVFLGLKLLVVGNEILTKKVRPDTAGNVAGKRNNHENPSQPSNDQEKRSMETYASAVSRGKVVVSSKDEGRGFHSFN